MSASGGLNELTWILFGVRVRGEDLGEGLLFVVSGDEEDDFFAVVDQRSGEGDARVAVVVPDGDESVGDRSEEHTLNSSH